MFEKNAVIFGMGGHAKSVASAVITMGFAIEDIVYVVDHISHLPLCDFFARSKIFTSDKLEVIAPAGLIHVAIGDNWLRQKISERFVGEQASLKYGATFLHASACISAGVKVGRGVFIGANSYIGPGCIIDDGSIVNTGAVIEHDCTIGRFASLAPGAVLGGGSLLGPRSFIGMGAVIREKITIGQDSVIGSSSYVTRDLPSNVVSYGVPAKILKGRKASEPYLR